VWPSQVFLQTFGLVVALVGPCGMVVALVGFGVVVSGLSVVLPYLHATLGLNFLNESGLLQTTSWLSMADTAVQPCVHRTIAAFADWSVARVNRSALTLCKKPPYFTASKPPVCEGGYGSMHTWLDSSVGH
jgi:hypothetical protein